MVRRRWLVTGRGRRKACVKVASPSFPSRAPLEKNQHPGPAASPFPQALSARFRHRYVGSESGELPGGMGRTQWAGLMVEGREGVPGNCSPSLASGWWLSSGTSGSRPLRLFQSSTF